MPSATLRSTRSLAVVAAIAIVLATLALGFVAAPPAGAAQPAPGHTGLVPSTPRTNTPRISTGEIWDIEVVGQRVFIAGTFSSLQNTTGNTAVVNQRYLASYNYQTGLIDTAFRPTFGGGGVNAVEASPGRHQAVRRRLLQHHQRRHQAQDRLASASPPAPRSPASPPTPAPRPPPWPPPTRPCTWAATSRPSTAPPGSAWSRSTAPPARSSPASSTTCPAASASTAPSPCSSSSSPTTTPSCWWSTPAARSPTRTATASA